LGTAVGRTTSAALQQLLVQLPMAAYPHLALARLLHRSRLNKILPKVLLLNSDLGVVLFSILQFMIRTS
jgi:hypothetical protein